MIRIMYMSETILSPRQSFILNIINGAEGLLREEIREKIEKLYPISKPTLIRDLNVLLSRGFARANGRAKATRYKPAADNPLLRQFDLDNYFVLDADWRVGSKKSFDFFDFVLRAGEYLLYQTLIY